MTNFYVDANGVFLGIWVGNHEAPEGGISVPFAPVDSRQVWDFGSQSWGAVPLIVPPIVTMRQARLALLQEGLLDQVETLLASLEGPEGQAARIEWDYSSEVHRNKPFVISLGTQLGLTEEQMDDLFITASQID